MHYNKEKNYNQNIKEKVDALILECRKESVPCFITVAVANNDTETSYISEAVTPNSLSMNLCDDKIVDHINVLNGFKTVPYTNLYDESKDSKSKIAIEDDWTDGKDFEELMPQ